MQAATTLIEAQGALALYWDATLNEAVIVIPGDGSRVIVDSIMSNLGIKARVEIAHVTGSEIDKILEALGALADDPRLGAASYGFYFDPVLGQVVLEGSAPSEVFAGLLSTYGDEVLYRPGEGGGRLSRHSDFAPFWGGAEVRDNQGSTYDCTTGIPVKCGSGTEFMSTAGHCFPLNAEVFSPGNGLSMGTIHVRAAFPAKDMELIKGKDRAGFVYVGGGGGAEGVAQIGGAADPVVGFSAYCHSGATTFEQCGKTATSLNGQFCDAAGCTGNLAVFTGGNLGLPGDSGAPMYLYSGGLIFIRAMLIARFNNNEYGQKWSTISGSWGVTVLTN